MIRNINIAIICILFVLTLVASIPVSQKVIRVKNLILGFSNIFVVILAAAIVQDLLSVFEPIRFEYHPNSWSQNWPGFIYYFIGVDFIFYFFHLLSHKIPLLWETHKLHHNDVEVNFTSHYKHDYRNVVFFIFFILILSWLANLDIYKLSVCMAILGLYQLLLHSSNWNWPKWLSFILILPQEHRIHHRVDGQNKYYGGVFPFWDRLAATRLMKSGLNSP